MDHNELAGSILKKLQKSNPAFIQDLTIPMAFGTLSKPEFSVAMSLRWVTYKNNKYYFTEAFKSCMEKQEVPTSTPRPPRANAAAVKVANATENVGLPVGEIATIPRGANQLRILEVIYRGTNKLEHPNLLLIGETEAHESKRVERGIPLAIAKAMCLHPDKFNGKVISIDSKNNFVGIVLAHSQPEVPQSAGKHPEADLPSI